MNNTAPKLEVLPKPSIVDFTQQPQLTQEERDAAFAFGKSRNLTDNILDLYQARGLVVSDEETALLYYLSSCSRLLDEPLCITSISSSGAGKSALQSATLELSPPESIVRVSSLSPKCLFYQDKNALRHKVLAIEELAGANDETLLYSLRTLISEGALRYQTTSRQNGKIGVTEMVVNGPASVWVTTTQCNVNSETLSRTFLVGIDESPEATAQIIQSQREAASLEGMLRKVRCKELTELSRSFQRLLKPWTVVIPESLFSQSEWSDLRLEARRGHQRFINLIRATAHLRQLNKEVQNFDQEGLRLSYIQADQEDIELASRIYDKLYRRSLADLKPPARELLQRLQAWIGEKSPAATWTRREAIEATGYSKTRFHTYLQELLDCEYVAKVSGKKNCLSHYRLLEVS